jgi:lipoprotein-releasing system permease protein
VSPNLQIAFRFLVAKRRAMMLSLACIVLGVGFFVVTQAITAGFQQLFITTLLGTDGAIRIQDKMQDAIYETGVEDIDRVRLYLQHGGGPLAC